MASTLRVPGAGEQPISSVARGTDVKAMAGRGGLGVQLMRSKEKKALRFLAHEPEDAQLTGATRSLYRRLTGLNLSEGYPAKKVGRVGPVSCEMAS